MGRRSRLRRLDQRRGFNRSPSVRRRDRGTAESNIAVRAGQWVLPASKSHLIRWIALASQSRGAMRINHVGELGEDSINMIRGLEFLGAEIQISDGHGRRLCIKWDIPTCSQRPNRHRQLRNGMQVHDGVGILHGAPSLNHGGYPRLEARPFEVITGALGRLGMQRLQRGTDGDFMVSGPAVPGKVALDLSKGSQPLSALLIAAPSMGVDIEVEIQGEPVSRDTSI